MSNVDGAIHSDKLRSFVDRIERLLEEKREVADQIKEVKSEAKSEGFDIKVINQMIKERATPAHQRSEFEELCDLYRAALGMIGQADAAAGRGQEVDP